MSAKSDPFVRLQAQVFNRYEFRPTFVRRRIQCKIILDSFCSGTRHVCPEYRNTRAKAPLHQIAYAELAQVDIAPWPCTTLTRAPSTYHHIFLLLPQNIHKLPQWANKKCICIKNKAAIEADDIEKINTTKWGNYIVLFEWTSTLNNKIK